MKMLLLWGCSMHSILCLLPSARYLFARLLPDHSEGRWGVVKDDVNVSSYSFSFVLTFETLALFRCTARVVSRLPLHAISCFYNS